jgi:hypothetical protein
MDAAVRRRATDQIVALAARGTDVVPFWRACREVLADTVPHYLSPCWFTLDPASLVMTSHFQEGLPEFPAEWAAQEYSDDGDVNHLADVARSASGISTLYDATGGRPDTSPRWHANMAYGGDQELVAALRTRDGQVWGSLSLYREPDRPRFDRDDLDFLRAVAPVLADGVRRGLLVGEASDPKGPMALGCWCSPNNGPSSRCHPVSSDGCTIYPTALGTPAGCRRRYWRWPGGRSPSRRRR